MRDSNLYFEANEALYASIENLLEQYHQDADHDEDIFEGDGGADTFSDEIPVDGDVQPHKARQEEEDGNEGMADAAVQQADKTILLARAYSGYGKQRDCQPARQRSTKSSHPCTRVI